MGTLLLSIAYLAPVRYYALLAQYPKVTIEQHCHYNKQSYRNRCRIATANGVQTLSIPIEKPSTTKAYTKDIQIAQHGNWQHLHWNALVSAYQSSPFFMYYEDDFRPFYEKKYTFLFDFNESLRQLMCQLLDIDCQVEYSSEYLTQPEGIDLREALHPKRDYPQEAPPITLRPYYQVFNQKYGFIEDLSIVDLLFTMGPEGLLVLQ